MFQKFRPLNNNVWVKRILEEDKTAGGIYIPDAAKEETQKGKILAVGPGMQKENGSVAPVQVKEGDTVFFGKYAGTKAGDDFLVLKETDILGVIEE